MCMHAVDAPVCMCSPPCVDVCQRLANSVPHTLPYRCLYSFTSASEHNTHIHASSMYSDTNVSTLTCTHSHPCMHSTHPHCIALAHVRLLIHIHDPSLAFLPPPLAGEPMDKAGAFGIQAMGSQFVRSIEGTRTNAHACAWEGT